MSVVGCFAALGRALLRAKAWCPSSHTNVGIGLLTATRYYCVLQKLEPLTSVFDSLQSSLQGLQPAKQNVTQLVFEQSTHPGPCTLQWLRGKSIDRKVLGLNPMPCSWFQNVDSSSLSLNIGK